MDDAGEEGEEGEDAEEEMEEESMPVDEEMEEPSPDRVGDGGMATATARVRGVRHGRTPCARRARRRPTPKRRRGGRGATRAARGRCNLSTATCNS